MDIFNNFKELIKFIETKKDNKEEYLKKLHKLNDSIIKNFGLIFENKKDIGINDSDIIFDNEKEKNNITYYQKKFDDTNFKDIINLIKKPKKQTGGYDKNIFETFIKFIDNLTDLYNTDNNLKLIYKDIYIPYFIDKKIDKIITNIYSKEVKKEEEEVKKGGVGFKERFNKFNEKFGKKIKDKLIKFSFPKTLLKDEIIDKLIKNIPEITKKINDLKDLIIKVKNSNSSRIILEDYKIEKDSYLYSYNIEEFIGLLHRLYKSLNELFLEFIKKLTKELYNYDKNFFSDLKVQEEFKKGNIDKYFDFTGLSTVVLVNYDEIGLLLTRYEKDDADKIERLGFLDKYKEILSPTKGQWKKDYEKETDEKKKEKIQKIQERFNAMIIKYLSQETEVNGEFEEASQLFESLKTIKQKLEKGEKLQKDEFDKLNNQDKLIKKLQDNKIYKDNNEYLETIKSIRGLYDSIKNEGKSKEKLEEIQTAKQEGKEMDDFVIDPNKIYFADYVQVFKLSLKLLVYVAIFMIFFILLLSVVAFFKLLYDLIMNIIYLFVNGSTSTRGLTLDYLSKSITRCTKTNYDFDRFYILTEQKQNLTLFNIGIYMIYLLIIYIFLYFILLLYAKVVDKVYIANPSEIDKNSLFLTILIVIIGYSIIHLFIFKKIYKEYVYIPYKEIEKREKEIDGKVSDYILIYSDDEQKDILIDEVFFNILYDPSRIDELNKIFEEGIKTENNENCLEQKIIIYNLYNYLREYIVFDAVMQEKFKEYCTTTVENKPLYKENITMTFISLLDNNEVKMIKKYNEELPYYTNVSDDKLDYFNKLNMNINEKIKNINIKILINTNTSIPFFLTILYILFIVILNIVVIYIIIQVILSSSDGKNEFNEYIYKGLTMIDSYIYKPIINYLRGN